MSRGNEEDKRGTQQGGQGEGGVAKSSGRGGEERGRGKEMSGERGEVKEGGRPKEERGGYAGGRVADG